VFDVVVIGIGDICDVVGDVAVGVVVAVVIRHVVGVGVADVICVG